jgi:acetoacetyl-CoA synthetase
MLRPVWRQPRLVSSDRFIFFIRSFNITIQGCIWVSAAADFGPEGVLERSSLFPFLFQFIDLVSTHRFEQVRPKLIFSVDAVVSVFVEYLASHLLIYHSRYNGKVHPHLSKLSVLLSEMANRGLVPPKVVVIASNQNSETSVWDDNWITWDDFVKYGKVQKLGRTPDGEVEWKRQGFDWPLWILFSSGTTGLLSNISCYPGL